MDFQNAAAIVFILLLSLMLYLKRKKLSVQGPFPVLYFLMYRTKLGLKSMDYWAKKHRTLVQKLSIAGIVLGFIGMCFLSFTLIKSLLNIFLQPSAAQGVALVLPFEVKGAIGVPFFYWIICIFLIAVVHEFSHGLVARAWNIKLKSSGFAFLAILLPIIPAAFVEPDEKILRKRPAKEQLSVFAAGPFSNLLVALVMVLVIIFVMTPVLAYAFNPAGIQITKVAENSPAAAAGLQVESIITAINGKPMETVADFTTLMQETEPGQIITLAMQDGEQALMLAEHPEDAAKPYMGVFVQTKTEPSEQFLASFGSAAGNVLLWIAGLFYWMYLLNLGIGLFNLLPLGPIDGGRMLHVVLLKFFDEKKATKIWKNVSWLFLFIILIQIGFGFLK